jgi:threonine synthase
MGILPTAATPPEPLFAAACAACGESYPPSGLPAVCPLCGGFFRHTAGFAWRAPSAATGLRRWAAALGLTAEELPARPLASPAGLYAVDLGGTLGAVGAAPEVWICQQGSAPSGSYKERGAEVMAAAAQRRGVREIFLDSSGNAGIAVARAASQRHILCSVLVPAATPAVKIERIRAAGGEVVLIPGDRDATHAAAQEWRRRLPYAAPFFQPSFLAGVATLAWDLAADLGSPLPAHLLLPAGNGPLLLGLALGFSCLQRAGLISRLPALHAVQLQGYAALAPEGCGERRPGPPTAAGIAIGNPPRRADLRHWLAATGGDVTTVSEADIAAARRELAERGWTADPTGAAAFAAYRRRTDLAALRPAEGAAGPACAVIVTSREESLELN